MSDVESRLRTALDGRYDIQSEVGRGGMATVFLAEDVRHRRSVALKVLRSELSATLGPDRFLREIEIAAQLQHPHILPLYDSGKAGEFLYYVMPFVDGESLREKLSREHELSVREATKVLRDVVDALAHAHERGVVHRDIKPDNVMLSGGHAIVTDFGVAKAVSEATGRHELTTAGIALGTPTYMSPEQATGDTNVDHRADIYAIGVMAYEMLTGRTPFVGTSSQAILSAHLTAEPDPVTRYRSAVSPELEELVMRCLEKRPADRWQTTSALLGRLESVATPSGGVTPAGSLPAARRRSRSRTGAWVGAAALVAAAGAGAVWMLSGPEELHPGAITPITTDPGLEVDPAISPDGNTIAYAQGAPGRMAIYLRQTGVGRTIRLAEDLEAHHRWPQWSPDGQRIAFQSGGRYRESPGIFRALGGGILRIPALGGDPRPIIAPDPRVSTFSPTWSPDGRSVAYVRDDAIYRAPADGSGAPEHLFDADRPHSLHWSPNGRWIAYVSGNPQFTFGTAHIANIAPSAVWVAPADGGAEAVRLTSDEAMELSPVWTPDSRQLLFVSNRGGGRDIYRVPVGRSGTPSGNPVQMTTGLNVQTISLSGDGTRLAYSTYTSYTHIWSVTPEEGEPAYISRGGLEQLTFGQETIEGLVLAPDRSSIVYDSDRGGNFDTWRIPLDGGPPQQVTTHTSSEFVNDWSRDGSELAIHSFRTGSRDIFVLPAAGGPATPVTDSPAHELNPTWSPEGNRIAFQSDATGEFQLYVTSRPDRGQAWGEPRRITEEGGVDPYWSPDGSSIAYIDSEEGAIRIIDPEGSESRVLLQSRDAAEQPVPEIAIWSADGRTIYYKAYDDQRRSSIWSIPAAGGDPTLHVMFDDPSRPSLRREFATDGTTFYFTIARHESDVWVMELTRD